MCLSVQIPLDIAKIVYSNSNVTVHLLTGTQKNKCFCSLLYVQYNVIQCIQMQ